VAESPIVALFLYVLSADNLSSVAGKTSFVRCSRNRAIVPNLFLQQGQPGTVTPLPPWATLDQPQM